MITLTSRHRQHLLSAVETLCRVFWGPNDRFCQSLQTGVFFQPFEALSTRIVFHPGDVLDQIRAVMNACPDVPSFCRTLETDYVRLFINHLGGVTAHLYESCYEKEDASLMGGAALAMQKRFESKGMALGKEINEPPDHLSIELEYLYFLMETGWREQDPALLEEATAFTATTLLPWLTSFSARLGEDTHGRFYSLAAALLLSILETITAKENPAAQ